MTMPLPGTGPELHTTPPSTAAELNAAFAELKAKRSPDEVFCDDFQTHVQALNERRAEERKKAVTDYLVEQFEKHNLTPKIFTIDLSGHRLIQERIALLAGKFLAEPLVYQSGILQLKELKNVVDGWFANNNPAVLTLIKDISAFVTQSQLPR